MAAAAPAEAAETAATVPAATLQPQVSLGPQEPQAPRRSATWEAPAEAAVSAEVAERVLPSSDGRWRRAREIENLWSLGESNP